MPRKKTSSENEARKPLIRIERIVYEKAAFKLSTTLLGNLSQYAAYVKEMTGEEASTDEIVEKGMQRLFEADRGFRQWLQRKASATSKTTKEERARPAEKIEGANVDLA
nr:DUF2274 domain-containing protein [Nitrosomonas nitrosa]